MVSNSIPTGTGMDYGGSTSPVATHSPTLSFGHHARPATRALRPFHHEDVKVLLLENVNMTGINKLKDQGYQVEALKGSMTDDQLIEKIRYVSCHFC